MLFSEFEDKFYKIHTSAVFAALLLAGLLRLLVPLISMTSHNIITFTFRRKLDLIPTNGIYQGFCCALALNSCDSLLLSFAF